MPIIESVQHRKVLNSHVQFTTEFTLTLRGGRQGRGSSPQGETISIYEDKKITITPDTILEALKSDRVLGRDWSQEEFDAYLRTRVATFGRNNAFSLSLAFFDASHDPEALHATAAEPPQLCLNLLNGGWHAYTNPVLSDFPEYLLVAKSRNVEEVIRQHHELQRVVRERLVGLPKTVISGNPVNRFATADNRECLDFLTGVLDSLGWSGQFGIMIDASAGDLWQEGGYRLALTDQSVRSSSEFAAYWEDLIRQYHLQFLEDPLREADADTWHQLTVSQQECRIIGDNFYSSHAERIAKGAAARQTHGVIIKPNQAGTVTDIRRAVEVALEHGQIAIASHRSISTEETFLSTLTCLYQIPYIKIGPLLTDYSSVVRLNAILRLTA